MYYINDISNAASNSRCTDCKHKLEFLNSLEYFGAGVDLLDYERNLLKKSQDRLTCQVDWYPLIYRRYNKMKLHKNAECCFE